MSHVAVFGSVLAQNIVNLPRRHPLSPLRPLVDAGIALLLMPCMITGHTVGVVLGPFLPARLIEVLAVCVLLFAAVKTLRSAYRLFAIELEEERTASTCVSKAFRYCRLRAEHPAHERLGDPPPGHVVSIASEDATDGAEHVDGGAVRAVRIEATPATTTWWQLGRQHEGGPPRNEPSDAARAPSAAAGAHPEVVGYVVAPVERGHDGGLPAHDAAAAAGEVDGVALVTASDALPGEPVYMPLGRSRQLPLPIDGGRVLLVLLVWVLFAADYRLSEADNRCTRAHSCFLPYATLHATIYAAVFGVILLSVVLIRRQHSEREAHGVPLMRGDLEWTLQRTISAQTMALLVGTIAGLLGLGGGELMAPLLVHLGMLPEVAGGVNAFIIFFTAAADLEHYNDIGVLELYADTITRPGYIITAVVVGFTGALTGRFAGLLIVDRLKHASLLTFALAATLALSAVLLIGRVLQEEGVHVRISSLACE